jgi:hypothetical protein
MKHIEAVANIALAIDKISRLLRGLSGLCGDTPMARLAIVASRGEYIAGRQGPEIKFVPLPKSHVLSKFTRPVRFGASNLPSIGPQPGPTSQPTRSGRLLELPIPLSNEMALLA